jgi:hypothetical protein
MVWAAVIFTFVYFVVIVLTDDPRTYFHRLAKKLTPEQEECIERLRQWIEYLHLAAVLLLLYAAWTLWLVYKYWLLRQASYPFTSPALHLLASGPFR